MTIKTIIETELDKIHGKDTYFIDTNRGEVEKTIDRIISTLLDEIEKNTLDQIDMNSMERQVFSSILNKYR